MLTKSVAKHFKELKKKYHGLNLKNNSTIEGILEFYAKYNELPELYCNYSVSIIIPSNYPKNMPLAKEIGGIIPKEYHKFDNETLCLGSPFRIQMIFNKTRTLLGFVNDLIVPYFYSFSYWKQYKQMPFGELPHGEEGILKDYCQFFKTKSYLITLSILQFLANNDYNDSIKCPCGSGQSIDTCHGHYIRQLITIKSRNDFQSDYDRCRFYIKTQDLFLPWSFNDKHLDLLVKYFKDTYQKTKSGLLMR